MNFNYDSAGIWLTDIPLLAIADFSPSSADVSEKLYLASSVLEKNVVLAEQQLLVVGNQQDAWFQQHLPLPGVMKVQARMHCLDW